MNIKNDFHCYIWQSKNWPHFKFDSQKVETEYQKYLYMKGTADSMFNILPEESQALMNADIIATETVFSSEIEGERLSYESVYSSVLRQLSMPCEAKTRKDANAENVSSVIVNAENDHSPLDEQRLLGWHKLLFEGQPKGKQPRNIGCYRKEPVYVVRHSGMSEDVVYEAVPHERVETEMTAFFDWLNGENSESLLVKSAIASIWFVSIHPFEDGNGRLSRAIADYVISKEWAGPRYFSMSAGIVRDRKGYYAQLAKAQTDDTCDITDWICWYISNTTECLNEAVTKFRKKLAAAEFMRNLDPSEFNSRQMYMLGKLADGSFYGALNAQKWMKMTKCTSATATRDLSELVEKGLLTRTGESSRNMRYSLISPACAR